MRSPEDGAGRGGSRPRSGGRRWRRIPCGRGRGAPRKAVVWEDDGCGRGGGLDDDDGGGSRTKKWPSAGGGGSLLLDIDTPLVSGHVKSNKGGPFVTVGDTTRDQRVILHGSLKRENFPL
jgi:hypothetical protein